MKKAISILFLNIVIIHAELSVKQINMMAQQIQKKRGGMVLKSIQNPFFIAKKPKPKITLVSKKKRQKPLVLHAILNQKAYINGKWRKIGETIEGYRLKYIGKKGVILVNADQVKKLFFYKKTKNRIKLKRK